MKSNYKKLGDYIRVVDERNKETRVTRLLGVSIDKKFIDSIANTIGTDMSIYKIVKRGQFAYGPVTSRNGDKVSIALLEEKECIISSSYTVFEIIDTNRLMPEYLNLWFKRPEFDRYARFHSHGSAREIFDWEEMCNVELPIPEIEEQKKIVEAYNAIEHRIELKRKINDNLESQATILVNRYQATTEMSVPLSDILYFENGYAFQSSTYLNNGSYRIITIKNVQDGMIDANEAAYIDSIPPSLKSGCKLHIGDVLISLTGNVGRVGIVCENNLLLNQRVAKIVPYYIDLLPFLYFIFRLPCTKMRLESISKGTAQLNLSPVETLRLSIPYKQTTAIQLSYVLKPVFNAIIANNREIITLKKVLNTLLPRLICNT